MSTASVSSDSSGRSWLWPALIVGGLAVHVVGLVLVVLIATRDPSFAVEPNSYQKALGWDASAARLRASQQLGWSASLQVDPLADIMGKRRLALRIVDKDGVAVVGATVQILMFHHARAADRIEVPLSPDSDGSYSATVLMKRSGFWECRVVARRGAALFSAVLMHEVPAH